MKNLLLLFVVLLFGQASPAFDILQYLNNRHEVKSQSRWSLSDWLMQKQKMKFMDLWLAQNRKDNLWDFYAGVSVGEVSLDDSETVLDSQSAGGAVGYSVFVVRGEVFKTETIEQDGWEVFGVLVPFGASLQGTHLEVGYGLTQWKTNSYKVSFPTWLAQLEISLLPFLGGSYTYKNLLPSQEENNLFKAEVEAHVIQFFVDIAIFRIFYRITNQRAKWHNLTVSKPFDKSHEQSAGLQFHF